MARRAGDAAALIASLRDGERVFMGGSTGEVTAVTERLDAGEGPLLDLTTSFVPGINAINVDAWPEGARLTGPFAFGARGAQAAGRVLQIPASYRGYCDWIARQEFDVAILHVAPPRDALVASLGLTAEFTTVALGRARRILAVINPEMPNLRHAVPVDLSRADQVFEIAAPLREYDVGAPSLTAEEIARGISEFVPDGAVLQIGLGKVPDALLKRLTDRRGLRLWSGMLSDGVRALAEAGALDPARRHESAVHVGSRAHYDWMAGRDDFFLSPCTRTHDAAMLAELGGLVAVNGAIEVDLLGQANLEAMSGRMVSGVGGAADFTRAAALDPQGVSVIGLPATSRGGANSRIVPQLSGPVSLPRQDVEVVVTEHGTADLRDLPTAARAEKLIAAAAPERRAQLTEAWREMVSGL